MDKTQPRAAKPLKRLAKLTREYIDRTFAAATE
jgi:hypothetical protein